VPTPQYAVIATSALTIIDGTGRIQELEHAGEQRPQEQWNNTMTAQATKVLNKQIKRSLEKTIDLRCRRRALTPSLSVEAPKENATECLRLMGMDLWNLASAMNNAQALKIVLYSTAPKEW
jgi:hypothetical protein